ncbi:APC family permease [Neolewinella aurantiaca]|uniref:APC family permease n=1 Tax=Neolewinella aurantiaca TaxID=2602767 RepID=A0A5C7FK54_9BACT|nr:APC family permease [Neolewinella aurantiaca]TXF86664.1 APC family permease [Neolewinella aurantiaca]
MQDSKISLRDAVSIGIGGMVGGGIFAVLGLAVDLARGATPLAFIVAGFIALVTAYSYAKLSVAYPDRGGTVRFVNEGFGKGVFSGGVNNLLWISYIIMLSLYAAAFGSYAPNLFGITGDDATDSHIYLSGIILLATFINYYSIAVVGKIESYAVIIKLVILLAFVALGFYGLVGNDNLGQLAPDNWVSPVDILTAGMVIFVAYEGFELIANSAPDLRDPGENIPKAYYYSVGFVILLYLAIAVITVGSLEFSEIATARDYVLAEAAKPMLGQIGFTIITVAALISTFSAINASLYGGSRVSYELAEDDELPHSLTDSLWNQPVGLAITAVLTLVMANTLKLESISTAGSVGFLLVFAVVNLVGYRKSADTGSNRIIPMVGFIICSVALVTLLVQQYQTARTGVLIAGGIVSACFLVEWGYKASRA